jgi:flagellar motor switch protein FliN/FliY
VAEEKSSAELSPAAPDAPQASGAHQAAATPSSERGIPPSVLKELQAAAASSKSVSRDRLVPREAAPAGGRTAASPETEPHESGIIGEQDIEFLLNQAQDALNSIEDEKNLPPGVKRFELDDFSGTPASSEAATLDLVRDVELDVNIELGRTHMHLSDVLRLKRGSVVPLDKLAGDPVDIYVNDRLIARGEVLVLNDNFCVRVAELVVGDKIAKP